jgi:hypothetical protein
MLILPIDFFWSFRILILVLDLNSDLISAPQNSGDIPELRDYRGDNNKI